MELLKILILEDVDDDAQLILRYLKREYDFKHLWVDNESDFIKGIHEFKPDLILSDFMLPGFDGMQALKLRNNLAPNTPFIVVTGSINELTAVDCIKSGATDYVTKEHLERLNVAVRNALKQKKTKEEKELVQKQLLENLQRFREFVENDISGDYIENEDQVLYCNKRTLEIFDFESIDELNAYGANNLFHHESDREKFFNTIKGKGKVIEYEVSMHTSKGRPLFLLENATGKFDEDGKLIEIQGYLIDITQRKLAEQKLRKSEQLFRHLSESMTAGLVIYNEDHFLFVNPATERITGFPAKEMLRMHFWDVVHPDHKEMIQSRGLKRLKKEEVPRNYTFKLLTKTGKTCWINFTASLIEFQGKKAALGTVFDITREKEAEIEIRKLSTVVEQNPLSIVITDTEGDIEFVNKAFCKVTGYSPKDVIGHNPRILQSGKTPKKRYIELWETITDGKVWIGEFINKKKNGQEYIEYAVVSPVMDEQGKIVQYTAIKEDITDRKRMEEEVIRSKKVAEEANRLKSAFLANMSHELRTPLNGILGFSELMRESTSLEETHEMTQFIYESGQRLLRTLKMILDISRMEAGSFQPEYKKLDVLAILKKVLEHYSEEASNKNLQLKITQTQEQLLLDADEKFLEDVIENMVDNAIKFTDDGSVSLSARKELVDGANYVVIEVSDTGIGISKESQNKIFEEFRQESEGYGRTFEGTGLGLSLAKKYVELMGGFIRLKSKVGLGSTFSIFIPETVSQQKESIVMN